MLLITQIVTGSNKLKEYELYAKGSDIKLKIDSSNFTEQMETIATYVEQISFSELFTYGPSNPDKEYPVYD